MLLTPEEAKKEICIQLKAAVLEPHHGNSPLRDFLCTGPDCKMGWRWEKNLQCPKCRSVASSLHNVPPRIECPYCEGSIKNVKVGYCGLAGKP